MEKSTIHQLTKGIIFIVLSIIVIAVQINVIKTALELQRTPPVYLLQTYTVILAVSVISYLVYFAISQGVDVYELIKVQRSYDNWHKDTFDTYSKLTTPKITGPQQDITLPPTPLNSTIKEMERYEVDLDEEYRTYKSNCLLHSNPNRVSKTEFIKHFNIFRFMNNRTYLIAASIEQKFKDSQPVAETPKEQKERLERVKGNMPDYYIDINKSNKEEPLNGTRITFTEPVSEINPIDLKFDKLEEGAKKVVNNLKGKRDVQK